MTYQSFVSKLSSIASERLPEDMMISFEDFLQNNGITKNAVVISAEGSSINPIIYLEDYYTRYIKGERLEDIFTDIISVYDKHKVHGDIRLPLNDLSWIKNKIIYRLVNYKRNFPLLCEIPHIKFLDLAIIFNICISAGDIYSAAVIGNSHIKAWNVGVNTLLNYAGKNTQKLLPENIRYISDILGNSADNDILCDPPDMYVLTNNICTYGACCILYSNILEEFAEKINDDVYILPSSVHEVILLPGKHKNSKKLSDMVSSINKTSLAPTEILSDHVYLYRKKTGEILF